MSKHSFTPGPWAYRPSNSGHFIAGAGENSGYLAEVRHCRTNQDVKADARLIAAAPDLLAICIRIHHELTLSSELHEQLSTAIRRATGGEP